MYVSTYKVKHLESVLAFSRSPPSVVKVASRERGKRGTVALVMSLRGEWKKERNATARGRRKCEEEEEMK